LRGDFAVELEPARPRQRLTGRRYFVVFQGSIALHLARILRRASPGLVAVGTCLGVYAILAMGFRWFVEPSMAKNQPPPAAVMKYADAPSVAAELPLAAPRRATPVSRVVLKQPPSRAVAAAALGAQDKSSEDASPKKPRRQVTHERRTPRSPLDFASGRSNGYRLWF
jgi:hypothetical protein